MHLLVFHLLSFIANILESLLAVRAAGELVYGRNLVSKFAGQAHRDSFLVPGGQTVPGLILEDMHSLSIAARRMTDEPEVQLQECKVLRHCISSKVANLNLRNQG